MSIKVIIADDHTLVREGIKSLLKDVEGIEVIAETGDGEETLLKTSTFKPDILILDISMPKVSGIRFCEKIKEISPETKIIILSMHFSKEYVREAFKYGAKGYILKDSSFTELEFAIKSVYEGNMYISPKISQILVEDYLDLLENPLEILTERQKEILKLIAEGYSIKEIANRLNLSVKTVETHKSQIMDKLGIYDIPGLVKYAIKHGLIDI
uniref:Response regulator transcription factor n=1 Tax=Dictyoglomus turgidum TaxID=513050 RepID=A0A7C3SQ89_9BACT